MGDKKSLHVTMLPQKHAYARNAMCFNPTPSRPQPLQHHCRQWWIAYCVHPKCPRTFVTVYTHLSYSNVNDDLYSQQSSPYVVYRYQLPCIRGRQILHCRWCGCYKALTAIWLVLIQRQTMARRLCVYMTSTMADLPGGNEWIHMGKKAWNRKERDH